MATKDNRKKINSLIKKITGGNVSIYPKIKLVMEIALPMMFACVPLIVFTL